jgi:hypothetical protein
MLDISEIPFCVFVLFHMRASEGIRSKNYQFFNTKVVADLKLREVAKINRY